MAEELAPKTNFVKIRFSAKDIKGRKLKYGHKNIRDAIKESGMSIGELLTDVFLGWPFLIRHGLMHQDLAVSLDKASEFMDAWVNEPDPDTGEERKLDALGKLLLEAINKSNFIKIEAENPIAGSNDGDADPNELAGTATRS